MERVDLDGLRLSQPNVPDVWLVFGGRRHRIADPDVYSSLFGTNTDVVSDLDIDLVDPGPEMNNGTCLVRANKTGMIFVATGATSTFRLMHIREYDSFLDFGFDMTKVWDMPQAVVDALPRGKTLISAGSRTLVHGFSVGSVPAVNAAR